MLRAFFKIILNICGVTLSRSLQDPVFEVVLGQSSMLELHGSQGRAFCHCIEATLSAPAASTGKQ